MISTIAFDADDTLWQNERFFRLTEERFGALLAPWCDTAEHDLAARLMAAERRNLSLYGFGAKGFTLSMIETAIEVSNGTVPAGVISDILAFGREMLAYPIELIAGVDDVLRSLSGRYRLLVVTKGDLVDQERKIAGSGLADMFDAVEVVSDKQVDTYARIFARHGDGPDRTVMVGNSLKSDIVPALAAGAWAVYVPHELTWAFEHCEEPQDAPRYRRIDSISELEMTLRDLL